MALKLSKKPSSDFIEHNKFSKKMYGLLIICVVILIVFTILFYLTFLRKLDLFEGTFVSLVLNHIKVNMFSYTPLGLFYVCLFGGLFFLFVPIETFYIVALRKGVVSPFHILGMAGGLLVSYSINYFIGLKFAKLSRRFVSTKKFYKTKLMINKFGKLAIMFFNLIGAGSQQLTFVLGVFRYNKTRLLVFSIIGQAVKYIIITAIMLGIFG